MCVYVYMCVCVMFRVWIWQFRGLLTDRDQKVWSNMAAYSKPYQKSLSGNKYAIKAKHIVNSGFALQLEPPFIILLAIIANL